MVNILLDDGVRNSKVLNSLFCRFFGDINMPTEALSPNMASNLLGWVPRSNFFGFKIPFFDFTYIYRYSV